MQADFLGVPVVRPKGHRDHGAGRGLPGWDWPPGCGRTRRKFRPSGRWTGALSLSWARRQRRAKLARWRQAVERSESLGRQLSASTEPALPTRREDLIARLAQPKHYDLAIIGGGATGLGVALDAAHAVSVWCWWSPTTLQRAPRRAPPSSCTAACAIWRRAISPGARGAARAHDAAAQRAAPGPASAFVMPSYKLVGDAVLWRRP
jgi:hypothetical protein